MSKRIITTLTLSALLATFLFWGTGCSKKTVIPPEKTGSEADAAGGKNIKYPLSEGGFSQEHMPKVGTLDDKQMGNSGSYADQQSDEYKRKHGRCSENLFPVYFDFDQAGIRPDMIPVITRNAEYLKTIAGRRVVIEGNSDERGTNEYNMALGERRAINVQQYLTNMGIDARSMQTLSYGEEKPLFTGQDEEAYSGNRRVDFIIK
ncbi:MAG: peptidoglycan-associated lipoprotein Pal [Desulfobulbaceae bacterium]|jgi:peptidoglycan-associated lipoprotein|nr:peptidoglycan-associated lipoprotein Pal [Desulfobulbaceae bacterium]